MSPKDLNRNPLPLGRGSIKRLASDMAGGVVWVSSCKEDCMLKLHITDEQLQGGMISKSDSEN